jgi:hypothetical protein
MSIPRNHVVGTLLLFVSLQSTAFVLNPLFSQRLRQKPLSAPALFAKAKTKSNRDKGNKQGGQKKSGFEWASSFTLKPFEVKSTRELASTVASSFEGRTGKPLCEVLKGASDLPKALWNAPVACVVVGPPQQSPSTTEGEDGNNKGSAEPTASVVVKYANVAALETVGLKPDEFERFIAPTDGKPIDNAVSIDLPPLIKGEKKYEGGYKKKIMRAVDDGSAEDITILDAHRWSIEKSALIDGKFMTESIGIAYAWKDWVIGEDTLCKPGGKRNSVVRPNDVEEAAGAGRCD